MKFLKKIICLHAYFKKKVYLFKYAMSASIKSLNHKLEKYYNFHLF